MGIKLINESERFTAEIEGCRFYYRRLPADVARRIQEKHTHRGEMDQAAIGDETFAYCILGWDGVEDANGDPAPFSVEALDYLPPKVIKELMANIMGTTDGTQVAGGPF